METLPFILIASIVPITACISVCVEIIKTTLEGTYNGVRSTIANRTTKNKKIKKIFSKSINTPTEMCVICLENYTKNDKCAMLKCEHVYHEQCLYEWFNERITCPLCNE